ncbi:MAG: peptide chain release factor 1 [Leptospiraceae bacterium]|nr:peptide chain release factor 1 [Leptospiraceae bacterium]MDW7975073.1 peptide chain release factor 1 [Leptospiraceae bacterium]
MDWKPLKDHLQKELDRFHELEYLLSQPEVLNDGEKFKELSKEHRRLSSYKDTIQNFLQKLKAYEEAKQILEDENSDKELKELAKMELEEIENYLNEHHLEIESLLLEPDPNEGKNIIMEIRAGTGGEEAALFAADLFRMYSKFCDKQGWKMEILSTSETGLGGYKEIVFSVQGDKAYELLHQEAGAHRVQRIPITEANGRIHTSAVTVAVIPEVEETEFEIDEKELRIDVFRASGAGGQHVNKTESAVRITHIPTGIVVSCQDERSQHKNKAKAMKILRARLKQLHDEQQHKEIADLKKSQVKTGDRSERIRTYNFPQGRVTDHRINFTMYNLEEFMNGEMLELLKELVKHEKLQKLEELRKNQTIQAKT